MLHLKSSGADPSPHASHFRSNRRARCARFGMACRRGHLIAALRAAETIPHLTPVIFEAIAVLDALGSGWRRRRGHLIAALRAAETIPHLTPAIFEATPCSMRSVRDGDVGGDTLSLRQMARETWGSSLRCLQNGDRMGMKSGLIFVFNASGSGMDGDESRKFFRNGDQGKGRGDHGDCQHCQK
jgi:hypothetical protein